jgi:hypothetical protein
MGKKNGMHSGMWHFDVVDGQISVGRWMSRSCRGLLNRVSWTVFRSYITTGTIVGFKAKLWVMDVKL